jgi:hypothetical protein
VGKKSSAGRAANYTLIPETAAPYKLLADVRKKWHRTLDGARIALAWRKRLKSDKDGHLLLGKCVKVSDLQKEFAEFDFIIVLNQEVWDAVDFQRARQMALLDHELCHAAPALDKYDTQVKDERGRLCWRTRKHDIEEFRSVVEHHGTYKRDLEAFARALLKKADAPLLAAVPDSPAQPEAAQ